ncbi:hypothetical protein [Methylomicrobium sp. Wu6]|uniref:hypothetical protein n=1 Tax=Methylomicrobium sp. Wu6 TaxID=3107928 RepID=UPI002DD6A96F|nr:hypothetical protein [Methylomicrobium sp. Wu6]MEC4749881.1 hypothetical protein [Methylomicrobium sp. Wu6]
MSYSTGPFTVDELGPIQTMLVKVLVAAAAGEIDLNRLAKEELAARGLDASGVWVGFERAQTILNKESSVAITIHSNEKP